MPRCSHPHKSNFHLSPQYTLWWMYGFSKTLDKTNPLPFDSYSSFCGALLTYSMYLRFANITKRPQKEQDDSSVLVFYSKASFLTYWYPHCQEWTTESLLRKLGIWTRCLPILPGVQESRFKDIYLPHPQHPSEGHHQLVPMEHYSTQRGTVKLSLCHQHISE